MLAAQAPGVAVVDLLNDLPGYDVAGAAHLLAALAPRVAPGNVFLAVLDPGVGTARDALVIEADGRAFVGPDNGLLSVLWQRAAERRCRSIAWKPEQLSASFHGRDLFAPVAARLAADRLPPEWLAPKAAPEVLLDPAPLARVIYVDHYGNCITGIPAQDIGRNAALRVGGRSLRFARVFDEAPPGEPFWHANSSGLVEISVARASAARSLGLAAGAAVEVAA